MQKTEKRLRKLANQESGKADIRLERISAAERVPVKVTLPPCVVFFDEVHQLRPEFVQSLLLGRTL